MISIELSENVSPCHVFGRISQAPALISRHFARGGVDTNLPAVGNASVAFRRGAERHGGRSLQNEILCPLCRSPFTSSRGNHHDQLDAQSGSETRRRRDTPARAAMCKSTTNQLTDRLAD
jgi:hypothetical protein